MNSGKHFWWRKRTGRTMSSLTVGMSKYNTFNKSPNIQLTVEIQPTNQPKKLDQGRRHARSASRSV